MKLAARISSIILLLILLLVPAMAASSNPKYPEFINGEPVIFVQNSENTFSLDSNLVILTVLDNDSNSMEESIAKFSDYLGNHQLPEGWSITVIGGPGASAEECLRVHDSFNDEVEKSGPITLGPIQASTSSEISETTELSLEPTFAIVVTWDPGFPYFETIKYIAAMWIAPVVGTEQSKYSALLVNGLTDTGYFMQSGQLYQYGTGLHNWASSAVNNKAQSFGIEYVPGHECWHFIAGYADGWYMCMEDVTAGVWVWHHDTQATGTKLVKSRSTSVFFENWNYDSNWYEGFNNSNDPTISVYKAYDGLSWPTSIHPWRGDHIVIVGSDGFEYFNSGKITGHLRNLGTATWHLKNLLCAWEV